MKPLATLALLVTFVLLSIASSAEADHVRPDGRRRHASRAGEPEPECRMGTNGQQACGYNCRMGTDGRVACADTPDGVCAMGTNGRVTCSRVARGGHRRAGDPEPECRMGTNGRQTCGYNCRMGTNGQFYCASRPDGRCAMNTDGTFSCP
jgi:hypothetical protein